MELEKASKIRFKPPAFVCDKCIHDQIEEPLPKAPFFMCIIGSAGSGKTSLAVNLLTSKQAYKRAFHHVHVVMPPRSVESLKRNVFKSHDKMYPELDYGTLDTINSRVMEAAEKKEYSMLFMDDVTASLKDNDIQREMKELIFNRRHLRLSIVLLVQSYNAMPLSIRKTMSHFAMFKPRNKKEYGAIFDEIIFLDKDTADKVMRFVFDEPYSFLFSDVDRGHLYKKFDRIKLNAA